MAAFSSFDALTFTGSHDWDRMSDRLSRQAILDEKIKKFLAVRDNYVYRRWLVLYLHDGGVHAACALTSCC